jgi:hypothetical protein
MAKDLFLIAPFQNGLDLSLKPWLIPDDAFEELRNVYNYKGRIKKRFGSILSGTGYTTDITMQMFSRLRINLGTTNPVTGILNGTAPGVIFKVGQMFSIEAEALTVSQSGLHDMLNTDPVGITVNTFNTAGGAYQITALGHLNKAVFFYPSEPVMGFSLYEAGPINDHTAIAYDNQFAYKFAGGYWVQFGPLSPEQWHGDDSNYFWSCNWRGTNSEDTLLFVTNFHTTLGAPTPATDDPLWYYDGANWASFEPLFRTTGEKVVTAKLIIPFKGRLLFLNTVEQNAAGNLNTTHTNRCRFSRIGNPIDVNISFLEPTQTGSQGGNFIDSPTKEEIISAAFIKDRLIVYFERSTKELVYTGNPGQPFVFQKINSEFGSEATFSTVPFDKNVLTIGTTGITACSGASVERIDQNIPKKVFEIINKYEGLNQIQGIRDYFSEMVYWTFPSDNVSKLNSFPDNILAFNYTNRTWSIFDDCVTAFGYFEQQDDLIWADWDTPWAGDTSTWVSGLSQSNARQIVIGNQQGFVSLLNPEIAENANNMQLSGMSFNTATGLTLTIDKHNLLSGDFIRLHDCTGVTINEDICYEVISRVDADNIIIMPTSFAGAYIGGGTVSRVSRIDIKSKQWNPYIKDGKNIAVSKISFCVLKTVAGKITVDYSPSSTDISLVQDGEISGARLGDNILETSAYDLVPLEGQQERLWHQIYFQGEGNCVQIRLYLTDDQMGIVATALSPFKLEGLILYASPAGEGF